MSATDYQLLADVVVLVHFAFVLFVIAGGWLALRWRWVMWLHIPAAIWGAVVEFVGVICPLTPLENYLRASAGELVYNGDFVAHYVLPVMYPAELTRATQIALGCFVVVINLSAYVLILRKRR